MQLEKIVKYGDYIVWEGPPSLVWPRITFANPDHMKNLMTAGCQIISSVLSQENDFKSKKNANQD